MLTASRKWAALSVIRFDSSRILVLSAVHALSPTELDLLLKAEADFFWLSMIRFAVRTGLRRGELRALRWSDIDFERRHLVVRRSRMDSHETTPKNNRERVVPLTTDALGALHEHTGPYSEYVFTLQGDVPVSDAAMARLVNHLRTGRRSTHRLARVAPHLRNRPRLKRRPASFGERAPWSRVH